MAHDERTNSNAEAQQKETRFILGMIRIGIHLGIFVIERSLSLLEGHAVFALIGPVLLFVPGKSEFIHMYIVCIKRPAVNSLRAGRSLRWALGSGEDVMKYRRRRLEKSPLFSNEAGHRLLLLKTESRGIRRPECSMGIRRQQRAHSCVPKRRLVTDLRYSSSSEMACAGIPLHASAFSRSR